MIPTNFISLNEFPLTANGKLDHRKLFTLEPENIGNTYHAPKTELEEKLCALWQDLFDIKQVGTTDHFFRIGGNSIIAIQAVHRINSLINFQITVGDLFQYPVIAQLAEFMSQKAEMIQSEEWDL